MCIFVGCLIVLIGTAIQGSAPNLAQFLGGRFVLGFVVDPSSLNSEVMKGRLTLVL
jgi:hypothetical protein